MRKMFRRLLPLLLALLLLLPGFAQATPVEDGLYSIGVLSSSNMFRVTDCLLEVEGGQMTAILTLSGTGYGYLFQGTPEEADAADRSSWVPYTQDEQGDYSYRVIIPKLDEPVEMAAYSKKYEKWYERQLTFQSGSLRKVEREAPRSATPIPADGLYIIQAASDSPLLKVLSCQLRVDGGQMQAQVQVEQASYGFLFAGKAKDALKAPEENRIPLITDDAGQHSYTVPVAELDVKLPYATWSEGKSLWYDRTLTFDSSTLKAVQEQAAPSFAFTGGTGRTTISLVKLDESQSPPLATIAFSSANYTQVKIGETVYLNQNEGGDATFVLPLQVNGTTQISAETVAMSKPRWIDYALHLYTDGTDASLLTQQDQQSDAPKAAPAAMERPEIPGLVYQGDMPFEYAQNVVIRLYEGGFRLLQTANGRNYLVVPEEQAAPAGLPEGLMVLKQPLGRVYLVATSAMCLIDAMDALPRLQFTGTKAESWHIEAAREALEKGELLYAGKYNAPDYELLLSMGCDLALESTMVLQAPEVEAKMQELDIPMFIDMAGLESQPLGRTEWALVYGVLFSKEEAARQLFEGQKAAMANIKPTEDGATAAYFYVSSAGAIVTKSGGDYFPALLAMAGGRYLGPAGSDRDTSSVTMDMESFYALAKDADYLFYNGAIDNPPESLKELLAKNELFSDFKAVQAGRVFGVSGALYQSSHRFGEVARQLHSLLEDASAAMPADGFFVKLP